MLEQIAGAQAALESDIEVLRHAASMGGDGAALAVAQNQIARLSGLQHRIESAQGGGLAAVRAEVMASVAASQTLAQQARGAAANAHIAERALHAAQAEAHRVTSDFVHDFYERKIFDSYLRFASSDEETAYRQREEERQRAIEKALAEGTPEATARATALARAQLLDAGAHGADQSPDFQRRLDALTRSQAELDNQIASSNAGNEKADYRSANAVLDSPIVVEVPPAVLDVMRTLALPDQSARGHGVTAAIAQTSPGGFRA